MSFVKPGIGPVGLRWAVGGQSLPELVPARGQRPGGRRSAAGGVPGTRPSLEEAAAFSHGRQPVENDLRPNRKRKPQSRRRRGEGRGGERRRGGGETRSRNGAGRFRPWAVLFAGNRQLATDCCSWRQGDPGRLTASVGGGRPHRSQFWFGTNASVVHGRAGTLRAGEGRRKDEFG